MPGPQHVPGHVDGEPTFGSFVVVVLLVGSFSALSRYVCLESLVSVSVIS